MDPHHNLHDVEKYFDLNGTLEGDQMYEGDATSESQNEGKSQNRRQHPVRKIVDSPFMLRTEKLSPNPQSLKKSKLAPPTLQWAAML
jgi:hypothetical protein